MSCIKDMEDAGVVRAKGQMQAVITQKYNVECIFDVGLDLPGGLHPLLVCEVGI